MNQKIVISSFLICILLSTTVFAWPTLLTREVQTCTDSDNGIIFWDAGHVYGLNLNGSIYGEDPNGDRDLYPVFPDNNGNIPTYGLKPDGDTMSYYLDPNGNIENFPHLDFCMSENILAEWVCYYDPIKQTMNVRLYEVNCKNLGMICLGYSHIRGRCF